VAGLHEPEGIAVTAGADGGLLAIADEAPEAGGPNLKLIGWRTLSDALGLELAAGPLSEQQPAVVRPVVETELMPSYGDAADDPAIWVHPEDPSESLVIGTDKQSGLYVYDLEGRLLQSLPDGQINNVDVRYGFPLGGTDVAIVAGSNRSDDSINVYRVDAGDGNGEKEPEPTLGLLDGTRDVAVRVRERRVGPHFHLGGGHQCASSAAVSPPSCPSASSPCPTATGWACVTSSR
jgi:myo-inositol-hexaphosphate 3-phosphohydrolase